MISGVGGARVGGMGYGLRGMDSENGDMGFAGMVAVRARTVWEEV